MSRDFEWHFGDELPDEALEEGQGPRRWRRWLIWSLVLVLVAGGIYVWWRRRQRSLERAEAQVQQVARLELRALSEGDDELYLSLQDSADAGWREAQAAYVDTAGLPLPLQGLTEIETSVAGARVVGDRARVQIKHTAGTSTGESAAFRATRFYRFTEQGRWVHTKVDPDYGGTLVRFVGSQVELQTLEEDADWLELMVSGLETLVLDYCDLTSCELDLPLVLDLGASLEEAAVPGDHVLPAPFLVGVPKDEAARAAWEAGLQEFLLHRLIDLEIGSRSPDVHTSEVFRERLYAWFWRRLGLSEPLSLDRALAREALDSESWIPLWELWSLPPGDVRRPLAEAEIDLLLTFIEDQHGAAAVAGLPRALRDADHPGEAIRAVVREPWWGFRRRYLAYVREMTAEQSNRLSAFPSYDLLVRCRETLGSTSFEAVWGLRLGERGRTLLSTAADGGALQPISWSPDGDRLLLVREGDDGLAFYLLRADRSEPQLLTTIPDGADPVGSALLGQTGWSPDGTHLAYRVLGQPVAGGVIDLRTGDRSEFEGDFVAWGPDSSRLIYAQPIPWHWSPEVRVRTFWVWDRRSGRAQRLGHGYAAAWSADGGRIAYVTPEPALRAYNLLSDETVRLLDKASLRRTLDFTPTLSPIAGRPFELDWSPTGVHIAVGATRTRDDGSEEGLTLLFGWGDHRLIGRQEGGVTGLGWSPDGRWVTTFTFAPGKFRTVVRGVEGEILFEGERAYISWSPRGRYVAVEEGPSLRILGIESGRWQEVRIPGGCGPLLWNPRLASEKH